MAAEADLVSDIARLAFLVQAAHERRAREHGASPTLARLLSLLRDRTPTMIELAGLLGLDKSSTSGLVKRAQHRGLVRRVPSQLDRRSVRVRLTKAGSDLEEALAACLAPDLAALLEPLPGRQHQALTESLRAIIGPDNGPR